MRTEWYHFAEVSSRDLFGPFQSSAYHRRRNNHRREHFRGDPARRLNPGDVLYSAAALTAASRAEQFLFAPIHLLLN
jgi:hypothetical protein